MPIDARSLGRVHLDIAGVNTPRLDEYFAEWAMEEQRFQALLNMAQRTNWTSHVAARADEPRTHLESQLRVLPGPTNGERGDNIVIVPITGTLMKQRASFTQSTSLVELKKVCRDLERDGNVGCVIFEVDSPGGTVSGTFEVVEQVQKLAKAKHVIVYVRDLMASAAYAIGCQGHRIYANVNTALIGSIGTLLGLYDFSKAFKEEGIEAVVFATGELKGTGFVGAPITAKQREYLQSRVERMQETFDAAVLRGRGFTAEQLAKVRSGAVWAAPDAMKLKLIDGVKSFEEVVAEAFDHVITGSTRSRPATKQESDMNEDTTTTTPAATAAPQQPAAKPEKAETPDVIAKIGADAKDERAANAPPATLAEIKAALPKSDAAFQLKCLEDKCTLAECKDRYMAKLEADNDAISKELAQVRIAAEKLRGHDGVAAQVADKDARSEAAQKYENLSPGLARFAAGFSLPSAKNESLVTSN